MFQKRTKLAKADPEMLFKAFYVLLTTRPRDAKRHWKPIKTNAATQLWY